MLKSSSMSSSVQPTLRLAIYRTSSIGDVVLATACLDLLVRLGLSAEVTWIGRGASLELIAAAWPEVKTIEIKRDDPGSQLQRALEQLAGIHLMIDLQCNLRSRLLARQLRTQHKIPTFFATKDQWRRGRLIMQARLRGRRKPLPEVARHVIRPQYKMMCDALREGLRQHLPKDRRSDIDYPAYPRLNVADSFDRPWRKELKFGTWLAIAPGAAHATKQAPLEQVVKMIDAATKAFAVSEDKSLGLVFLGDDHDRQVARRLLDALNWTGPVLNLAGRLSLFESAVALKEVACLLSNDSSLAHIAEAVDTPVAVLFGPTIESFGFAPRKEQSQAFSSLTGCRPCSKHGKVSCRYDDKLCFTAVPYTSVAEYLVKQLRKGKAAGAEGRSASRQEMELC